MKIMKYPEKTAELINNFRNIGGVIDFIILDAPDKKSDEYTLHRTAAIIGMETIKQNTEAEYHDFAPKFQIYPEKIKGKKNSVEEFMGPFFDFKKRSLIFQGLLFSDQQKISDDPFGFYYAGDRQSKENLREKPGEYGGYAYAFSSPPYKIKGTYGPEGLNPVVTASINNLFISINNQLFDDFKNVEIYKWSDDWSDYFDAGKEWWGTFYWTVCIKDKNIIIVIAASSTD